MHEKYGPWAFITGGSEGIGAEIGNTLAAMGVNICMVARNEAALIQQQKHLQSAYGVDVITEQLDLTEPAAIGRVIELSSSLDIGFYAHVASTAPLGAYLDTSQQRHHQSLQINVTAVHDLTYHFAGLMKQRGSGAIILCSSMASLHPFPFNAQYGANKGYIRLLGEALWYELQEWNIDVLTLVISEVSTPALLRSGSEMQNGPTTLTPAQVTAEAFAALGKKPSVVTGRINKVAAFVTSHLIPKQWMMSFFAKEIKRYKEPPSEH